MFTDAALQPVLTAGVECALWAGIFGASGAQTIGGFPRSSYLAYALWTPFFARAAANWMYEFRMTEDVSSGAVNATLSRPISFYEFYLGQFMGYKLLTTALSLIPALAAVALLDTPTRLERLPLALALAGFYLVLAHTISFSIAAIGFYLNNVHSVTVAKNISLWMLTGELFPLDLAPEPLRSFLMAMPFSSACYRPVGFLIGRIGYRELGIGFLNVAIGLAVFGAIARALWIGGRKRYSGTGA